MKSPDKIYIGEKQVQPNGFCGLAWYSGNSDIPPTGDKAIKSLYNDLKKL